MNPATATVIAAIVAGVVAVVVAIINSAFGRKGARADIADKVSKAWDPIVDELNTTVADLKAKLAAARSALRLLIRAERAGDDAAVSAAVDNAEQVLDST